MNETTLFDQISEFIKPPAAILVSACLLGINCRYDGQSKFQPDLVRIMENFFIIPVCPEQLGGLPTPRPPAEIQCGTGADVLSGHARILTTTRLDVTDAFRRGARETEKISRLFKVTIAILQQRSPSCGFGKIYQNQKLIAGNGATAELLHQAGIRILSIG